MRPVGSKYLLEEPLGRGATGTVWRARQKETAGAEAAVAGQPGETVAIKVLKEELAGDPDVVMRFLRERSVLLRLTHHNIVRTRDLVVEGDLLALVMDLIEGPDLQRYLRENGPFSPVAAALVTAQVADALAASHRDGVVHRDLKPANVLLAGGPEGMLPMLTDFGIARLADSPGLTRTQEFVGTPSYVAPEAAQGHAQTSAVDIYGAGILLYELATGQPPFAGGSALEVIQRHLAEEPARPPSMPDPLWTVTERCLRKRPEERPGAENLANALRTVAAGIGAQATPEQAAAAMGVAGLLAPDPTPAAVPETGSGGVGGTAAAAAGGAVAGAAAGAAAASADPTQVLPHSASASASGHGQDGQYDPNAATSFLPQGGQGGGADAWEPDGPHPWENQMRAARDRNEQTQVQPLDPSMDPLRRRPQRQPSPQQPPGGRRQGPPPEHYARQQRRPAQPPPQRYEPRPPPRREPRPSREPRRGASPMRIPGLGCLKGCLFMALLAVVASVLLWNLTPLPEWWEQGKSFWESVQNMFTEIGNLLDSAPK